MNGDALVKHVLPQIEELLKTFERMERSQHHYDWSGIDIKDASEFITGVV